MLKDAIRSLQLQTLPPSEIIVVDDGSDPPVDADALAREFGLVLHVIRNEECCGLAFSRNAGVQAANNDVIVHLDDDDLLAPETLEEVYSLFASDSELDIVFVGVRGFGSNAEHFNAAQPAALARVREIADGRELAPQRVYYDQRLMKALLQTVPAAFQHTASRKTAWQKTTELRWRAYGIGLDTDGEIAKQRIFGTLRDSEWTIYAAAVCKKMVLLDQPRYLFRISGQNYSSHPGNLEVHLWQLVGIKAQLLQASAVITELRGWKRTIRASLAATRFDAAYLYFRKGKYALARQHLQEALYLYPHLRHMKLALRLLMRAARRRRDEN